MKIYLASSWRNRLQPQVVEALTLAGHEVYDFRNPPQGKGFQWTSIDQNWQLWSLDIYQISLSHPFAIAGFNHDFNFMKWADACVLLLPCGKSAHLEAGWFVGMGKPLYILLSEVDFEPELMYKFASGIYLSTQELIDSLRSTK